MAAALEYLGISKIYRGLWRGKTVRALSDFTLSIEPGEIFGFLGPNGAGKTTAIHLALGFMCCSAGSGTLLGRPFGHAGTRAQVGFLAENVALYHRPAAELVAFYGALNGVPGTELGRRVRKMLQDVELEAEARRNVGKFSRGMLQRIGIAQALINDPELLILDEPTSALDPGARVRVREILLRAREEGRTVFLSSHLLSEVEMICDRIGIIRGGRLVRVGRTTELLEDSERCTVCARGIAASALPGATTSSDGRVAITIPCSVQRETIERIWALGGEVVTVSPVRRSLEEVFLQLMGEEGRAA